jgi:hypothetical protein
MFCAVVCVHKQQQQHQQLTIVPACQLALARWGPWCFRKPICQSEVYDPAFPGVGISCQAASDRREQNSSREASTQQHVRHNNTKRKIKYGCVSSESSAIGAT